MNTNILQEISNWKLEAKLEDHDRYFLKTSEFVSVENGTKCFVIGRKGTGKTAISNYLKKNCEYDKFSEGLNFQNFPFNELYSLTDGKYTAPNQYITLWKFVIYSSLLKMMCNNSKIDESFRATLYKIFPNGIEDSLSKRIKDWTTRKIGLKGFGFGFDYGDTITLSDNTTPWVDRVELLSKIIATHIDSSKYYLLFDELDDDYKNLDKSENEVQYFSLLTSLFKAVYSIKLSFAETNINVFPVIFLRNDIYERIFDSDKSKWSDLSVNLGWGIGKIKQLFAYRITKAFNSKTECILDFDKAWSKISESKKVYKNGEGYELIFHLWMLTFDRPRDLISYLRICSERAWKIEDKLRFDATIVKNSEINYSKYLKGEIRDEIYTEFPDILNIFKIFSNMKKQNFSKYDFEEYYERFVRQKKVEDRNPEDVLSKLYDFSVIGNISRSSDSKRYFKYLENDSNFLVNEPICIHRGLYKAFYLD